MSQLEIGERIDKTNCVKCGKEIDVSAFQPFFEIECPHCHAKQTVPVRLGHFLLLQQLGSGGMGAVYKGLDPTLNRQVAIKVMKASLGDDQQVVENFLREARTTAALNHPNIVQIYTCGQEKGQPYIAMELVGGGRLDQQIAGGKSVPEVRALEIALHVAEGLRAASEAGLVHSDIKPANILFDQAGTAKIVDFGLAQFLSRQQAKGEIWGTPYYIAPECARGQKADHRSDLYSLGATLFHALTGKPPFDGKTATDVVLARLKAPAPNIRDLNPSLQPKTAQIIARLLQDDPTFRYPTAKSLMADLREALQEAKETHKTPTRGVAKSMEKSSRSYTGWIIGLVLMIGLGFVGWWLMSQKKKTEPAPVVAPPPVTTTVVVKTEEKLSPESITVFSDFTSSNIAESAKHLTTTNPLAMSTALEEVLSKLPRGGPQTLWIRLLQTIPLWASGQPEKANELLLRISQANPKQEKSHPVYMPIILARFIRGGIDEQRLGELTPSWPSWYGDLLKFYEGAHALMEGNSEKGTKSLTDYLAATTNHPSWVYSFKPLAQQWLQQIQVAQAARTQITTLVAGGQTAQAKSEIEKFIAQAPPFTKKTMDDLLFQMREAEQAAAAEQKQAAQQAHNEKIQRDLDKLDKVLEQNLPLLNQKEYRKAIQALTQILSGLETPEGKESLQAVRESYERMEKLKAFLIECITAEPFRDFAGTDLGGEAIGANAAGVRILVGGRGTLVKPWDQISARSLLKMAAFYASDTTRSPNERADQLVSITVFCYYNGGYDLATTYAEQAVGLNSETALSIRKLMPDIIAE